MCAETIEIIISVANWAFYCVRRCGAKSMCLSVCVVHVQRKSASKSRTIQFKSIKIWFSILFHERRRRRRKNACKNHIHTQRATVHRRGRWRHSVTSLTHSQDPNSIGLNDNSRRKASRSHAHTSTHSIEHTLCVFVVLSWSFVTYPLSTSQSLCFHFWIKKQQLISELAVTDPISLFQTPIVFLFC